MNAHAHPDPDLSATLASLSLATPFAAPPPPRRLGGSLPLLVVVFALLAGGAAYAFLPLRFFGEDAGRSNAVTASVPAADTQTQAGIAPASPLATMSRAVTGSGHVIALAEVSVHARRGGTVAELGADIGTRVSSGQVLLRLDDPDLRFALNAAELARDRARLELKARHFDVKEAEAAARRTRTLSAKGALGEQAARDAGAAAERAANRAAQAKGDLAEAELAVSRAVQALEDLTVRAPISGVVTARDARLGEAILAQADARGDVALFTITDPDRLALDVDIAETALGDVAVGQRGEAVLDAYPDRPFAVTVTRIAPVASAERGTIALRLAIPDPPPGMRPAMAARVTLQTAVELASVPSGQEP